MSQEQAQRPEAIKYGDVFDVSGELASKPILPQDAAALQAAENLVLSQAPRGGPASVLQSVAAANQSGGAVPNDQMNEIVSHHGITFSQTETAHYRLVSESLAGQVLGRYAQAKDVDMADVDNDAANNITIGEAMDATGRVAGDRPIDESDAAAIQAAEARATGLGHVVPGGVAAEAQSAAASNARATSDEDKTMLGDVLADASAKLMRDKAVTVEDAKGVIRSEIRNKPDMATHPGGVAAAMAMSARLNQEK